MKPKTLLNRALATVALAAPFLAPTPLCALTSDPRVGDPVASFELTWSSRTPQEIAERAQAIGNALFGTAAGTVEAHPLSTPEGAVRRWSISFPGAPSWQVRYVADCDEYRGLDLSSSYPTASSGDVGEAAARDVALAAFRRLGETGALDERQYDWSGAEVASTWLLNGAVDVSYLERLRVDYRFTVRRSIDGIELANSGLRLAVDVSGRVSGFRLGGVTVASEVGADGIERPVGSGGWQIRRVESAELRERFLRESVPAGAEAVVAWARVMYAMPDEAVSGQTVLVEPRYVVSYAVRSQTGDGAEVSSRRLIRSYSITDPSASALDLAPPARDPVPDSEPKTTEP